MNKRNEIGGCVYCEYNNSRHLKIVDWYIPKCEEICKEKKCRYYNDIRGLSDDSLVGEIICPDSDRSALDEKVYAWVKKHGIISEER